MSENKDSGTTKLKPFSIYKHLLLLEMNDENNQEDYNVIKSELESEQFREIIKGVFICEADNAIVHMFCVIQKMSHSYQGISESIKTLKAMNVADISDMKPAMKDFS